MKVIRFICMFLGAALLTAALLLVIHNVREDKEKGVQAQETVEMLRSMLPEPTEPATDTLLPYFKPSEPDENEPTEAEMPVLVLDGEDYIGLLSIPTLGLELPVQRTWSYPALRESPCRYSGSIPGGDLVIAAHNYRSHFGRIGELSVDSVLLFTDASNTVYRYTVTETEQLPPTAVEDMRFSDSDAWDLTLFTCTLSGQSRVTVRCKLDESE